MARSIFGLVVGKHAIDMISQIVHNAVGGRSNEGKFQQVLEFARDATVGVDSSGAIVVVNRAAELLFGYGRGELIGRPLEGLVRERFRGVHSRHRAYACDPRGRVVGGRRPMFGLRRDGTEFAAEVSLSSVQTGEGTLAMAAVRDISERLWAEARAEEELHRRAIVAAILEAEAAERARIASSLHDDTVQVMTASLVMLDRVADAVRQYGDADVQALIDSTRTVIERATERTRHLTFELRPAVLHGSGISSALEEIVQQAGEAIDAEVSVSAPGERFDWAVEELVYRTVQEAVANIRKHSQARHITVTVERLDDGLKGVVADDGCGFDVAAATDPSSQVLHMGMNAMIERVRMAGGSIVVDSGPGRGSRVSFQLPLRGADYD
jgi:PAS domain S-box-containing protein